jgi:hypothetical protein
VRARDERRRELLRGIMRRWRKPRKSKAMNERALAETVDVLHTLTSFETFDTLAGPARSIEQVTPLVLKLVFQTVGVREN